MPSTVVHGVDIAALEGWMVKINSNPSMFGKNTSRRWFHVSYVPAGNDQKLVISYSTTKTSKEPRGWLFIEDVSGVYCRRDMIEVVSPARTLRFKGETAVEHRLWSDSLHKLCNPPKPAAAATRSVDEEKRLASEAEQRQQKLRDQDRDRIADPKRTREHIDTGRKSIAESDARSRREPSPEQRRPRHKENKRHADADSDDGEQSDSGSDRRSGGRGQVNGSDDDCSDGEEEEAPRRRQSLEPVRNAAASAHDEAAAAQQRRHSARDILTPAASREPPAAIASGRSPRRNGSDESDESDDDEDDEDDDRRQAKQLASQARPSLLVASIKSMPPVTVGTAAAEPKAVDVRKPRMPAREDIKAAARFDDDEGDEKEDNDRSPHEVTPRRETGTRNLSPAQVEYSRSMQKEEEEEHPVRKTNAKPPKAKQDSAYFDDEGNDAEAEGGEQDDTNNTRRPSLPGPMPTSHKAADSAIRADNNFAEDDWDADDTPVEAAPPPSSKQLTSPEKRPIASGGGITADSNFATEDWD